MYVEKIDVWNSLVNIRDNSEGKTKELAQKFLSQLNTAGGSIIKKESLPFILSNKKLAITFPC